MTDKLRRSIADGNIFDGNGGRRAPWVVPALSRLSAGDAENAVAPVDDDGINVS